MNKAQAQAAKLFNSAKTNKALFEIVDYHAELFSSLMVLFATDLELSESDIKESFESLLNDTTLIFRDFSLYRKDIKTSMQ